MSLLEHFRSVVLKLVEGILSNPTSVMEACAEPIFYNQERIQKIWLGTVPCAGFFNGRVSVTSHCDESAVVKIIGAGSRVPGGAQAPPELFLAPPESFEPPLTIEQIMH